MNDDLSIKFLREVLKSAGDENELSDDDAMAFIELAKEDAEDDHSDIVVMIGEMREHAKNNKRRIYNEDRPLEFRLGWRCAQTGKTWSIKMEALGRSLDIKADDSWETKTMKLMLRESITSVSGRVAICHYINSKV
jgi:hypothetical protein